VATVTWGFLFVQAAWVVLIKPKVWERHGLKPWIEAARKRLHHNVLAIALANKLARIAWNVLARQLFRPRFSNAQHLLCCLRERLPASAKNKNAGS